MKLLQAKSVSASFDENAIFNELDVCLNRGEYWGILGANGAGKTTLLHLLARLRKADSGQVDVLGKDINHYNRKELAQKIGILFQDSVDSFPVTVLETVLTGRYPHLPFCNDKTELDRNCHGQYRADHRCTTIDSPAPW